MMMIGRATLLRIAASATPRRWSGDVVNGRIRRKQYGMYGRKLDCAAAKDSKIIHNVPVFVLRSI